MELTAFCRVSIHCLGFGSLAPPQFEFDMGQR